MNPEHTIPTIKHGDFIMHESHAIAKYVANYFGSEKAKMLYPEDPVVRAMIDARSFFHEGTFYPRCAETMVMK